MKRARRHRPERRLLATAAAAVILISGAGSGLVGVLPAPSPARAALVATGIADSLTVSHDRTLVGAAPGVLANDLNLLGGTSAILVSDVTDGELNLRANGGYTYVPDPGFVGTDSFRYRPSGLLSTAATATITVTNAAPVANADAYTWSGGTLVIAAPGVLANDTDADGDILIAEIDGGGISGSFDLDEDGGFRYSPGGGFSGTGTVQYRVWDGLAWSATVTIRLTIVAPTPTPTPVPTAQPSPTPGPTLPPVSPLPSIGLPVPSLLPLPSLPLEPPRPSPSPGLTRSPSPQPSDQPTSRPSPSGAPGSDSGAGAGLPTRPTDVGGGSGVAGAAPSGLRLAPHGGDDELGLQPGPLDLLAGIEIWAVPAGTIGVSGLLLLLWIALQTGGALAWMPAVRRLRGQDDPAVA